MEAQDQDVPCVQLPSSLPAIGYLTNFCGCHTVGPAVEAFGFERIIFGSAPSPTSRAASTSSAGDWYEIARESFAELGVDQETVDGIFGNNAKRVYGKRA